jgi:hypothetical protein
MRNKLIKNAAFLGGVAGDYRAFLPVFRIMGRRYRNLSRSDTELCVDGFPRSGNSFLVAAIQRWNPDIALSHHTHLAANVKFAVRHGVPAVVLLRKPVDAVASAMVWDGKITAWVGLFAYIHFYRSLARIIDMPLLVGFGDAVGRPDAVVEAVNRRFGTRFSWRKFDTGEEQQIRAYLVRHDARNERTPSRSTLPNEEKGELKRAVGQEIEQCSLYDRAERLWRKLAPRCVDL